MKYKEYDRSVMHFKVSRLQRKLVIHGIISMSLVIHSCCSVSAEFVSLEVSEVRLDKSYLIFNNPSHAW